MGDRSWVIPLKMPDSPPNGNRPNAVLRIIGCPTAHREIDGVGIGGPLAHPAQAFGSDEFDVERTGEARDEFHLQLAELRPFAVEAVGPYVRAGFGRDELSVERDILADPPHAALEDIA